MNYEPKSFDERVKENIRNYQFEGLFPREFTVALLFGAMEAFGTKFHLTNRQGATIFISDEFHMEKDVPELKIVVYDKVIGRLYGDYSAVEANKKDVAMKMTENIVFILSSYGKESYYHQEAAAYMDDISESTAKPEERTDALTGVFSKVYFEHRMEIIDRSEVIPVALVEANINDWKVVNDRYGNDESDRLIQIVADIIQTNAKPEYIIGRVDGDVFLIMIPMPEEDEADTYMQTIQTACKEYEDEKLAPSIACGIAYKTNVEESLSDLVSDAEYAMLQNKIFIKNSEDYCIRLKKRL